MRTISHAEYLEMRRFPALDGMRAIAAVIVVIFHFAGPKWSWLNGWIGVHLFFVLSGFLITTLALREESRTGKLSIRDFYLRRAFRILPVYYVVLLIIVAFLWLRGEFFGYHMQEQLPYYLTFTNEWATPGRIYGQSWTLGVEQKFYLVWPALMFTVGAFTLKRRLPMTIGLMALAVVGHFSGVSGLSAAAYFMILMGCVLALVMHNPKGFAVIRPFTHPLAALPVLVAAVVVQTNIAEIDDWFGGSGGLIPVAMYGIAISLLVTSTLGRGPVQWLLSVRPMAFMGERSYSLYLIQEIACFAVIYTIPRFSTPRLATALLVTLVALVMADLLYRWVELPMIELGRRLTKRVQARKAPAAAVRQPELATTSA
ncbi:acyltransferase [Lentzea sp. NPDC003310]|uniref:acyltransferase family protein n=1 Tax=Lentzea sp. NPDC003310 TaxID=3154447 RepID=UPI0033BDA9DC